MKHLDEWVHEFITGPEQLSRSDMQSCMKRAGLTETEIKIVCTEVEQARNAEARFVQHRDAGLFGGVA